METVKLKNGSEEAAGLVKVTMVALKKMFKKQPILTYELVMKLQGQ